MMKKLLRHIPPTCRHALLLLPALTLLLTTACQEEAATETAAIAMTFSARAAGTTATGSGVLSTYEHMRKLRVIVVRQNPQEIVFNVTYDIPEEATKKVITFNELTVNPKGEKFDFYALANESEAHKEQLEALTVDQLETLVYKHILTTEIDDWNTDSVYLPQACYKEITVPTTDNTAQMELQFPVGKIVLNIKNETGAEAEVNDIKIANVAPNQAYLFYQGNVPANTTYKGNVTFSDMKIATGTEANPTTQTQYCYIYPSAAGAGSYQLTATWEGMERTLMLYSTAEPNGISYIPRGQLLNITVTLKPGHFGVNCIVQPWEGEETEYELSDKGTFTIEDTEDTNVQKFEYSYTEGEGNGATTVTKHAIATQYNEDEKSDPYARYATFPIKMDSPKGVKWQAHLTNASDFAFEGPAAGVGGEEDPVIVRVRPLKKFEAGENRGTELYVTMGLSDDRQVLISGGKEEWEKYCSEDGITIPIVQVSTAEGDKLWNTAQP